MKNTNDESPAPATPQKIPPFAMKVSATTDGMVLIEQIARSTDSQAGLFQTTFQLRIPPDQAANIAKQLMGMAQRAARAKAVVVVPSGALPRN